MHSMQLDVHRKFSKESYIMYVTLGEWGYLVKTYGELHCVLGITT